MKSVQSIVRILLHKHTIGVTLLTAALAVGAAFADEPEKTNDWAAAYCPHAMPAPREEPLGKPAIRAFSNPYMDLYQKYVKRDLEARAEKMRREAWHYDHCIDWTYAVAATPVLAYESHQLLLSQGDAKAAALFSKAKIRDQMLDMVDSYMADDPGDGAFWRNIVSEVVNLGYSKKMAEMPMPQAQEKITRETFCKCLAHPTESLWERSND